MCGICGSVGLDAAENVRRQLDTLAHRGPDASGFFSGSGAAIGQNRLAIIDLVTGDPPMTDESGKVGAVLNGEIYNFAALRGELRHGGHVLASRGDTEVIAHLAESLAPVELARRLDGMFAFAVWDKGRRRLVLGRDRLGKKPLYYWSSANGFVFGSEIKAVLAHTAVSRELDPAAVPAYLTFGYVPTPATFFRGIRSLPPGHVLTFEPGRSPEIEPFWRPPVRANGQLAPADARREVRRELESAVQRRLVADVPLGAFLSGGIDSSAIVAIMSRASDRPVASFTIGFEDRQGYDERAYARMVANRYRTDHHEFVVAPNAVDLMERLVWHHDQPFGDPSALPTYLLSELTRQHVTVALTGDGGDELFGGYERFSAAVALQRYRKVPRLLRDALQRGLDRLPPDAFSGAVERARRFTAVADENTLGAYRSWVSFLTEPERKAALEIADDWALVEYDRVWQESAGLPLVERLLQLNLRTYLVDDLLVKADRMSMAHALEVRSPFLDAELVAVARKVPSALKVRGFSRKRVLRDAVADLLPAEILDRRKRGFGVPLDRWFRMDLRSYIKSTLGSSSSRVRQHVAPEVTDRLIEEHDRGVRNHGEALWMLLTLEVFLRAQNW